MLSELKEEVEAFEQSPMLRGKAIRDLFEQSHGDFCAAAAEILSTDASERARRYLVAVLRANDLLIRCLSDSRIPIGKAVRIVAFARRVDPQLPGKLAVFALASSDREVHPDAARALALLQSMSDTVNLRPLLTPLLQHANPRVRSKAALISGCGNPNRPWIERRMQEEDPRVRANIIEAVGSGAAEDLQPILEAAARDGNNRVTGNALAALYRLGDTSAIAGIRSMQRRPEPAFRATAAWAMGNTGDTRFLPVLARMLRDPERAVKSSAVRALQKLHKKENVEKELPEIFQVDIVGSPEVESSTLHIALSVRREREPCRGISPVSIRVLVDGETAFDYSVVEQESRLRFATVILLPVAEDLEPSEQSHLRHSIEECFSWRLPGEPWLIGRFSHRRMDDTQAGTLFGVRLDAPRKPVLHPVRSGDELRAILDRADCTWAPGFCDAVWAACAVLRTSRLHARVLAVDPSIPADFDPKPLANVARDRRVAIHTVGKGQDHRIRSLCAMTAGRWWIADPAAGLPALYHSIRHCYLVSVNTDGVMQNVKAAVHTTEGWGSSVSVGIESF